MQRDRTARLGRTQKLVIQALAEQNLTVRELVYHWPMLVESSVYSALDALGHRGLVDATGWNGGRQYGLTDAGRVVERTVSGLDEEE